MQYLSKRMSTQPRTKDTGVVIEKRSLARAAQRNATGSSFGVSVFYDPWRWPDLEKLQHKFLITGQCEYAIII